MSVTRRALFAFVLSMALFLAYDAIYLSPKVKQRQAKQAEETRRQAALADSLGLTWPDTSAVASGSPALEPYQKPSGPLASAQDAGVASEQIDPGQASLPSKSITVASDLFEITITSQGAEVTSMRLLEYETEGQSVELFEQNPEWSYTRALNTTLGTGDATTLDLTDVVFEPYRSDQIEPMLDGTVIRLHNAGDTAEIVFRMPGEQSSTVERYYRFAAGQYLFETGVRFSQSQLPTTREVTWGLGPGLRSTETNTKDDYQNFRASVLLGEEHHQLKPGHFSDKTVESYSGSLGWATVQTKYFLAALIPKETGRGAAEIGGRKDGNHLTASITLPAVPAGNQVDQAITVYMGPLDYSSLKDMGQGLEKNIELGWRLIRPMSWVILWLFTWMYQYIPNYGIVIIIISVLSKVVFYRLTHKSFKSMKDLQSLQPKIAALKEKFKDDRQRLSKETMKMYKTAGVNPLGGCMPMVLQMPVFIALFNVLRSTIEVRGAPFFGWITDLSQQEVMFQLPLSIPLIGDGFSLLPILMGASMFLQTKIGGSITGQPGSTTPAGFNTMLPIVFTVMFYKMPSGLVLYWLINTVLSIAQQYYIHRDSDGEDEGEPDSKATKAEPKAPAKARNSRARAKRSKSTKK